MNKNIITFVSLMLISGCTARSNTVQLWENENEYVLVEERYLSPESIVALKEKAATSKDILYDSRGAFYIKQSVAERTGNLALVVICTPIAMALDGMNFVARSAIVPENMKDYSAEGKFYRPTYFIASSIEREKYMKEHPELQQNGVVSGMDIFGIINCVGSIHF